ncbi:SLATT domain-containing protein [Nitrosomonas nitrosa]|uniref:SLATT domain-containing protein n=1 Tax=Nitrosomonas nitrosa TaxID=52442 RepID=UPI0021598BC4|nr:SLATT domain-containing protein [Nitrosomonas nitrosa]
MVALSVAPAFDVLSWAKGNDVDFWSLVLSVILLGIAALEAGDNRLEKASRLHENALKIDDLYRRTKTLAKNEISKEKLDELATEYGSILSKCQFNHNEIDILRNNFTNSWLGWCVRGFSLLGWFLLSIKHYGIYWSVILGPPAALFLTMK